MSLDVELTGESHQESHTCSCGHSHTKEVCETYFEANITHNLNEMAQAAGIYKILWRPDEAGVTKASQIIEPLKEGIEMMKGMPDKFQPLSASNGWGTYEQFIPWLEKYLKACEEYPYANVRVSR